MAPRADAGLTVESGGVQFPLVRTFWTGDAQRNLGAAVRKKRVAILHVKVWVCDELFQSPAD